MKHYFSLFALLPILFISFTGTVYAQTIDAGIVAGRYTLGDSFGTTTQLYNQYQSGVPVGIRQVLPPSLTGPIGAFVFHASVGTYACVLRNESLGQFWADNSPDSNGVQVLCDFTSFNLTYSATNTYAITLYHAGTPYSAPVTVSGSEATTRTFVAGLDGQPFASEIPANVWVNGGLSTSNIKTLYVSFAAIADAAGYSTELAGLLNARNEVCATVDLDCYGRKLLSAAFQPSDASIQRLRDLPFDTKSPFAYAFAVKNTWDVAMSASSTAAFLEIDLHDFMPVTLTGSTTVTIISAEKTQQVLGTDMWNLLQNLLTAIMWIGFGWYLWNRAHTLV